MHAHPSMRDDDKASVYWSKYLVACTRNRSTEGRAQTAFRCRMRGVKGHLDQWGTEDQVREWWPEQAREHLHLFEGRCVDIGNGMDAEPPQAAV